MRNTPFEMINVVDEAVEERISALVRSLTKRERELVGYFSKGYSNAEAALVFGIATSTIKVHRSNVYKKLGVSTLKDLMNLLDVKSKFLQDQ